MKYLQLTDNDCYCGHMPRVISFIHTKTEYQFFLHAYFHILYLLNFQQYGYLQFQMSVHQSDNDCY
jgi:hypothetical protein